MARATFEVRITPLMRGIPGQVDGTPSGATAIAAEDTILVEQFLDLEVTHQLNEPRTGKVVLSIHDPVVANLQPWQQAVWIGYKRPLETISEAILYGQCNVVTDMAAETVTLDIQDPAIRVRRHYIRRGDEALNIDANRGTLPMHAASIETILNAARNTPEQQARGVPVLGIYDYHDYYQANYAEARPINFERGQECWDLIQQIVRDVGGPDFDMHPRWFFPTAGFYCNLWTYDPADPPPDLTGTPLARDLDPADPDDLATGEVTFDYGLGQDNLVGLVEEPGIPTTHAHVLDEPAVYRETCADADSSYDVGIFVDWIAAGFALQRPTPTADTDTSPLRALADAHVKAYGRPPRHLTATLRPDDALGFHYGHPEWGASVPPGTEYIGGEWYIGDYVRVRGLKGERSIDTLNRITKVDFKYDLAEDLVKINVELIPAVGGTPGDDDETEPVDGHPAGLTVAITSPDSYENVSGDAVAVAATASATGGIASVEFKIDGVLISPGGFDAASPYAVTLDTTALSEGQHTLTATATSNAGNVETVGIIINVQNVPPTVTITAPAEDAVLTGTAVAITATTGGGGGSGIYRVVFKVDGARIAPSLGDTTAPYSTTWNSESVADGAHTITAVVDDNDGQSATHTINVTTDNGIAPPPLPPPGSNLLYLDGRRIRLVADDSIVSMRGMGMHFTGFDAWDQATFDNLAAGGFTDIRANLQWEDLEPTEGGWNATNFARVHTNIQRAGNAGLRVRLVALINQPQWSNRFGILPNWTYDSDGPASPATGFNRASMFCCLVSHGEGYLRKLVQEFGAYEHVSGFEPCNEPDDFPASNVQAGTQIMLDWMRDEPDSAGKFFWVTNCYSSQSADDDYNDWPSINWSHGDLIATVHSYYAPNTTGDAGWSANGIRRESSPIYWNGSPTEAAHYATANKGSLRDHLESWHDLSVARNVPVELGEVGVQYNKATAAERLQWATDIVEAAELEEFSGIFWWIYGVSTSGNPWTASTTYPADIRPEVLQLTTFTAVF